MAVKIEELMSKQVVVARPHQTVQHVKDMMDRNHVHSIPVVDDEGEPVGIASVADLIGQKDGAPVSGVMTEKVYTVSAYDGPHVAARVMRNHKIRHVVVTDEQTVVGILSAFDLLQLVEDHRFVMKNPPTPKRKESKRQ